ncbi:MAG: ATP-binding protein [Gammaproteobacteria bacterium]|nr:MAG: ATP-binding protein [Gammaproteobacteria bacterium]
MTITQLKPDALYQRCDLEQFGFRTTAELEDLGDIIGQPRAVDAVRFGIGIQHKGYNIFALGPTGIGKHELVQRYALDQARTEPPPPDWCYVNNFQQPHAPRMLRMPPGRGVELERDMEQLVEDLHAAIPTVFESDEYHIRLRSIEEELNEKKEQVLKEIQSNAGKKRIALIHTPTGFTLAPVRKGEALSQEDFENLSEKKRKRIEQDTEDLQEQLRKMLHDAPKLEKEARDRMSKLNREMAASAISHLIDALREKYKELPEVIKYLDEVGNDVIENFRHFLRHEEEKHGLQILGIELPQRDEGMQVDKRYHVNAFITHDEHDGVPVIYEDHPSYNNLIGRVEHRAELGALLTDFTMIRPGALHRANGGYLILDALKVLMQSFAWEGLKRALQAGVIRIESLAQLMSLVSTVSLEPEPIPLDIKVILLGEPHIYYLLSLFDPEFSELFKVAVDFDYRMDRNPETHQLYARLIGTLVRKEDLRHLDRSAVARVIEHSARLLEDGEKLLTHTRSLTDILREADYWATQHKHKTVTSKDVQQAIDARIYRVDRIREHMQEEIRRGTLLIDTAGQKTGQINGLSVLDLGNFMFGRPSRITARVRMGDSDVVDIEREVELGGPIHSKGVFILSAFLGARYLLDRPLALSASLAFEQSYGEVEGDSASSAELYALLSALADAPIRQSLAVTGSINQQGEIQPIGGVNEKIEGFFDICNVRDLTGDQGVIIPATNVKHLMLREDVRDAVEAGKFAIHAIDTVDDGIELLTGIAAGQRNDQGLFPDGSINHRVEDTLTRYSETMQTYASKGGKGDSAQEKASS